MKDAADMVRIDRKPNTAMGRRIMKASRVKNVFMSFCARHKESLNAGGALRAPLKAGHPREAAGVLTRPRRAGKDSPHDGPTDLRDRDHLWLAYNAGWSRLVLNS